MRISNIKQKLGGIRTFIFAHKPLVAIIVLVIIAFGVNAWRKWDDEQNAIPSQETAEQEEEAGQIHIGWSNLAVLGVLIAALGVVKYKKSLNTDKDINESGKNE
jgi:C4-dicarboxylate transporter